LLLLSLRVGLIGVLLSSLLFTSRRDNHRSKYDCGKESRRPNARSCSIFSGHFICPPENVTCREYYTTIVPIIEAKVRKFISLAGEYKKYRKLSARTFAGDVISDGSKKLTILLNR
jgi:hypothetical protein